MSHIETPFGRMWTVCTHLDYKFDASATRMAQCEALCGIVSQLRNDPEVELPVLLAGDFNAVPDSDEYVGSCSSCCRYSHGGRVAARSSYQEH